MLAAGTAFLPLLLILYSLFIFVWCASRLSKRPPPAPPTVYSSVLCQQVLPIASSSLLGAVTGSFAGLRRFTLVAGRCGLPREVLLSVETGGGMAILAITGTMRTHRHALSFGVPCINHFRQKIQKR